MDPVGNYESKEEKTNLIGRLFQIFYGVMHFYFLYSINSFKQ